MRTRHWLDSSTHRTRPSGGMGTRRPTAPLAEFYMAKGLYEAEGLVRRDRVPGPKGRGRSRCAAPRPGERR